MLFTKQNLKNIIESNTSKIAIELNSRHYHSYQTLFLANNNCCVIVCCFLDNNIFHENTMLSILIHLQWMKGKRIRFVCDVFLAVLRFA